MNTLTNPDAARAVAHQLITERVRDAERARTARAVRHESRAARATRQQPAPRPLPSWAVRFLGLAH